VTPQKAAHLGFRAADVEITSWADKNRGRWIVYDSKSQRILTSFWHGGLPEACEWRATLAAVEIVHRAAGKPKEPLA
jgi:hypothetical protein